MWRKTRKIRTQCKILFSYVNINANENDDDEDDQHADSDSEIRLQGEQIIIFRSASIFVDADCFYEVTY